MSDEFDRRKHLEFTKMGHLYSDTVGKDGESIENLAAQNNWRRGTKLPSTTYYQVAGGFFSH